MDNFLKNSSFAETGNGNSFKYDLEMKKGSTVIFDELCVHRGSAPKLNSRIVLRYFYRKNKVKKIIFFYKNYKNCIKFSIYNYN